MNENKNENGIMAADLAETHAEKQANKHAAPLDLIQECGGEDPKRVLLYGPAGIGKTTFGAAAPAPIFIRTEAAFGKVKASSFPVAQTLADVYNYLRALCMGEHDYLTMVIDTVSSLEPLLWKDVCDREKKKDIEAFGYGKGYTYAEAEWRKLLTAIDATLERQPQMGCILLGHSEVIRFEAPDLEPYDTYSVALHKKARATVERWADTILCAQEKAYLVTEEEGFGKKRVRAVGDGERVMYTQNRPAWTAKNRHDLPLELPLSFKAFAAALQEGGE